MKALSVRSIAVVLGQFAPFASGAAQSTAGIPPSIVTPDKVTSLETSHLGLRSPRCCCLPFDEVTYGTLSYVLPVWRKAAPGLGF